MKIIAPSKMYFSCWVDHDCWTVNEAKTLDLMKQGRQIYKIFDNMIKDIKLVTLTYRIMNVYCKKNCIYYSRFITICSCTAISTINYTFIISNSVSWILIPWNWLWDSSKMELNHTRFVISKVEYHPEINIRHLLKTECICSTFLKLCFSRG